MPRTKRTFTDEFKREAVRLVKQPGARVPQIARDLVSEQGVLRRRVTQAFSGVMDIQAHKPLRSESVSEVERLRRTCAASPRNATSQKSARLLCKEPAVKRAFIVRHRDVWPRRAICRAMNGSDSCLYEGFGRPPSARIHTNARLTRSIPESFELSDRAYGNPRVWHDLRAADDHRSINRVAQLMKQNRLDLAKYIV